MAEASINDILHPRWRDEEIARLREALAYVNKCLDKSVELQSHYARLLNQYDGGERMAILNGDKWMTRLRFLESKERDQKSR